MKLWLVGKYNRPWEFQGIFTTKSKAIKQCIHKNYFIAPVFLNKSIPDRLLDWPGLEYPLLKVRND